MVESDHPGTGRSATMVQATPRSKTGATVAMAVSSDSASSQAMSGATPVRRRRLQASSPFSVASHIPWSNLQPPQLLRVADRVDARDPAVRDHERERRAVAVL